MEPTKVLEVDTLPPLAPNHAVVVASPAPRRVRRSVVAAAAVGFSGMLLLVLAPWRPPPAATECGYYRAADGERVRRPCGNWRDGEKKPTGATARCGDGTWSYSRRPSSPGTCSGHGGVVRDG